MTATSIDWNWDDDVEDDIDFDYALVETTDEDGTKSVVVRRVPRPTDFPRRRVTDPDAGSGLPVDIWFQISKHIAPEDVGRFAGICQDTLAITHSRTFWLDMYHRFRNKRCSLPSALAPDRMVAKNGLRYRVIRMLQYTYTPYQSRLNSPHFYTPKLLLGRRCSLMSYRKTRNFWAFIFKFKLVDRSLSRREKTEDKTNAYNLKDDIMENQEEDCKALKVCCLNFPSAPPVMGMILNVLYTKVSSDMRSNNLFLGFSQGANSDPKTQERCLTLCNIMGMVVLDWWHPQYPHSDQSSSMTFDKTYRFYRM